ncbi:hypothetical protein [Pseudobdellovibrio exovorus]|uniref:Uncharacterized protein n=1 Tax=Pseudobdellovibrio exovorus JSS TaxID=1184267 RepID=M4VDU8_9BACT|nr:hypothetical protein [Pseudobdellovibrio exovorus]AGH96665.1 hypothetical protein A11Q_2449 [Pseudobdellovibrio exovorus JSS]
MSEHTKKQYIGDISAAMARIHKLLLENEIEFIEIKNGITLNANDRLNVLLNAVEVAWLREMSQLMAYVDEIYFQKEPITDDQWQTVKTRVEDLLVNAKETEFIKRYHKHLPVIPDLMREHGLLKVALQNTPHSTVQ